VGERIGLKDLGADATKGYYRYRLAVDRDTPVDFSPLGGEKAELDVPSWKTPLTEGADGKGYASRLRPQRKETYVRGSAEGRKLKRRLDRQQALLDELKRP